MTPKTKISEKRVAELDKIRVSWATLAPHVTKLTQDECLYIMEKEFMERNPPRPEFVGRMFFRAVRINREQMWKEIQSLSPGCGYRMRAGKKIRA